MPWQWCRVGAWCCIFLSTKLAFVHNQDSSQTNMFLRQRFLPPSSNFISPEIQSNIRRLEIKHHSDFLKHILPLFLHEFLKLTRDWVDQFMLSHGKYYLTIVRPKNWIWKSLDFQCLPSLFLPLEDAIQLLLASRRENPLHLNLQYHPQF